ncbi:MAG TPA: hypothetical protein VNI83_13965 [Vicinamibacterales bacterium]|nr:hypothetical protein [Vicinamibacterales bacterium]
MGGAVPDTQSRLPFDRWERTIEELSDVPFDRGERALECARAQKLIEELLEAYAVASEHERERLRALYAAHPAFFHTAERVLWRTADPLATARLHLLFYSLLDGGPDEREVWYLALPAIVENALKGEPPVSRRDLARVLREVASVSNRTSRSKTGTPMAEIFERIAGELLR